MTRKLNYRASVLKPTKEFVRAHPSLMKLVNPLLRLAYGSPARGRVAMFHVGRCGSTVLARLLGRHPQLHWGNELFGDVNYLEDFGIRTSRQWARLVIESAVYRRRCDYSGFETKATNLYHIGMTVEDYVALLRELGFNRYIILDRSNLLRVIVSSIVGGQTKRWHSHSLPTEPARVTVDVERPWSWWAGSGTILDVLESFEQYYARLARAIPDAERLDLNYEADIERSPYTAYTKVCRFLQIEPQPVDVQLARTNPFTLEQIVVNYDEVSCALSGTRFEWMLTA